MPKTKIKRFRDWLTKNYDAIYLDKDMTLKVGKARLDEIEDR